MDSVFSFFHTTPFFTAVSPFSLRSQFYLLADLYFCCFCLMIQKIASLKKIYIFLCSVQMRSNSCTLQNGSLTESSMLYKSSIHNLYNYCAGKKKSTKTSAQKVVHIWNIGPSLAQYWRELSSALLPAGSSVQFVSMIFNSWFKILLKLIISDLLNRYFRYTGQLY